MIDKLYGKFVKPLQKEIVKWMQSRVAEHGVDASEEMLKEDAYKIAVMLVLSASWGAGDSSDRYIAEQSLKNLEQLKKEVFADEG